MVDESGRRNVVAIAASQTFGDLAPVRIAEWGADFVCIDATEESTMVARSTTGFDWQPLATTLSLASIEFLASDGERLLAVSWPSMEDAAVGAWTSIEGGTTWTGGDLPLHPTGVSQYAPNDVSLLGAQSPRTPLS